MSKGAILDEGIIHVFGLGEQLLTLTAPIENLYHPVLQEPMFAIHAGESSETIYLDRKYIFDNQITIKPTYGKGEKVLVWIARTLRPHPHDPTAPQVEVLTARELFLLGDWREFQRFKQFVKSMRILDAQAREWLTDHHHELEQLCAHTEGLERVLLVLGRISEWPEVEGGTGNAHDASLEMVAKTFSKGLAHVRDAPKFCALLLRSDPDVRFSVFRLMSFVVDPVKGAAGLIGFLTGLARATHDPEVMQTAEVLKSSRDLARTFAVLRKFLLSKKTVNAGVADGAA